MADIRGRESRWRFRPRDEYQYRWTQALTQAVGLLGGSDRFAKPARHAERHAAETRGCMSRSRVRRSVAMEDLLRLCPARA